MEKKEFAERVAKLRINKGVSARDMSLSIGLSDGYINNVENCVNYPSMEVFFYICEYFGITPSEFFDTDSQNPTMEKELLKLLKGLDSKQLENLISLVKEIKK